MGLNGCTCCSIASSCLCWLWLDFWRYRRRSRWCSSSSSSLQCQPWPCSCSQGCHSRSEKWTQIGVCLGLKSLSWRRDCIQQPLRTHSISLHYSGCSLRTSDRVSRISTASSLSLTSVSTWSLCTMSFWMASSAEVTKSRCEVCRRPGYLRIALTVRPCQGICSLQNHS